MDMAEKAGVKVRFNIRLEELADGFVRCFDAAAGEALTLPCDNLLLAAGLRPRKDTVEALRHCIPEPDIYIVGDARSPQSIATAVNQAFGAAAEI